MSTYVAWAYMDSYMDGESADSNFGALTSIELGTVYLGEEKSERDRAIGNFDVSPLAGRTITAAQLERWIDGYVNGSNSWQVTIYRCTRPADWTEPGVTWNKYDGTNNWTNPGGDYDSSTPTPVSYYEPAAPPQKEVVTGLAGFVTDALNNRNGIVSIIMLPNVGDPGSTRWVSWVSGDGHGFGGRPKWRLVVTHSGDPIPIPLTERGFVRGAQRGLARGGS